MKQYIYQGPLSSVTLRDADNPANEIDIILSNGHKALLPENHEYTQALLAQGFLTAVDDDKPATKSSRARKVEDNENGS